MGGYFFDLSHSEEESKEPAQPRAGVKDTPTTDAFLYIMENFPDIIPDISEEFIADSTRSNGLSKAILMVQVGWFCSNCVSRLVEKLPLTLLEVTTAAHCLCTLLTYLVWWPKPFNPVVSTPMHGQKAREVHALLNCTPDEYRRALEIAEKKASKDALIYEDQDTSTNASTSETCNAELDRVNLAALVLKNLLPSPPARPQEVFLSENVLAVPGNVWSRKLLGNGMRAALLIFTTSFYGLPHFLGWNEAFPTSHERLLWRASTIMIANSGLLNELGKASMRHASTLMSLKNVDDLKTVVILTILFPYTIASGLLVVESVRQLFFLPPAAYELTSWSNYWPHFS